MQTIITVLSPNAQPEAYILDSSLSPGWQVMAAVIKPYISGQIERVRVWHGNACTDIVIVKHIQQKILLRNESG